MKNIFVLALALILVAPALAATKAACPTDKTAPLPELAIVKLTAKPLSNGKVLVTYTVKNTGHAKSGPSVTRVTISTAGIKPTQQNIPTLKPGEDVTKNVEYTIGKNGQYQFKVTADYLKQVPENNERNNENKVQFGFSRTI